MENIYLAVRLYESENYLGCNAYIRVIEKAPESNKTVGVLYVTFDHGFPRFLWEKVSLTASQKEYIELKAQIEVENEIFAIHNTEDISEIEE